MRRSSLATKFGGFLHVGLVLFERADAGNAKQVFQFVQEALLVAAGVVNCGEAMRVPFFAKTPKYI